MCECNCQRESLRTSCGLSPPPPSIKLTESPEEPMHGHSRIHCERGGWRSLWRYESTLVSICKQKYLCSGINTPRPASAPTLTWNTADFCVWVEKSPVVLFICKRKTLQRVWTQFDVHPPEFGGIDRISQSCCSSIMHKMMLIMFKNFQSGWFPEIFPHIISRVYSK